MSSSESESNDSVFNTVQKFEASKVIIKKSPPLGPPPPVPEKPKKLTADYENLNLNMNLNPPEGEASAVLQKLGQLSHINTDADVDSDSTLQVLSKTTSSSSSHKPKWKKSKELSETKRTDGISCSDPAIANLSQVPRKSSLKKTRSLPKLEAPKPKVKGVWYKMSDQYPVENFSGRQSILDQIHAVVFGQKSRDVRPISRAIVLAGKSGIGKTEIARKFAFKFYMDCKGDGNVIWINASTRESIVNTLLYLHEKELFSIQSATEEETQSLGPSVTDTKPKRERRKKGSSSDDVQQINAKLQSILTNKIFLDNPTIFIFDDATSEEQIVEFIPKLPPFGHIPSVLVTSRNENWNNSRVIKVGEFEFNEAVEFLTTNFKYIPEFTRFQGEDLAKELHRYPPLLQRAKSIVSSYLHTGNSERALLRLEKNVGLVRRLKNEEVIKVKELELAVLAVDRGHFYEDDAYIREYDGELRSHPIAMQFRQLETILEYVNPREDISILAINEDAYVLAVLANLIGSRSKVLGMYDSESSSEFTLDHLINCFNADNEDLLKDTKIQVRLVEVPKAKSAVPNPKQSKIVSVLDKLRAADGKTQLYDVILTNIFSGQDLKSVKHLLKKGGRFITSMNSSDTGLILKKVDSKKLEVKILKQDFPELLVVVRKL